MLPVSRGLENAMGMIYILLTLQLLCMAGVMVAGYHRDYPLMLNLVNNIRSKHGVPPLNHHDLLMVSGQEQSRQQLKRRRCTHAGDQGLWNRIDVTGIRPRAVAENVALTYNYDVPQVVGLWENSPGHFKNMVNPGFRYFGSGAVQDGNGAWYWTQHFATTQGEGHQYAPRNEVSQQKKPVGAGTGVPAASTVPMQGAPGLQQGYLDQLTGWWYGSGTSKSEPGAKETTSESSLPPVPGREQPKSECPFARYLAEQDQARLAQQTQQTATGPSNTAGSNETCPAKDLNQAIRDYSDEATTEGSSEAYNAFIARLQDPVMVAGMAAIVAGLGLAYAYRQQLFGFISRSYKGVIGWLRGTTAEKTDDKKVAPALALVGVDNASNGYVDLSSASLLIRFIDSRIGMTEYMSYVERASTMNKLGLLEGLVVMALYIISLQDLVGVRSKGLQGPVASSSYKLPHERATSILNLVARPSIPSGILGKFIGHSGLKGDQQFMQEVEAKVGEKPGEYQVKALFCMKEQGWKVSQLKVRPQHALSPEFASLVSDLIQYYLYDRSDVKYGIELTDRFKAHNRDFERRKKNLVIAKELKTLEALLEASKCLAPASKDEQKCRFINDWCRAYSARQRDAIVKNGLARLATLNSLKDVKAFEQDPPMLMWALRNLKDFSAKDVTDPIGKVVVKIASVRSPYPNASSCKFGHNVKTEIIIDPPWEAHVAPLVGASRRNITRCIVLWATNIKHPDLLPTPPYDPLSVEELFGMVMRSYCLSQADKNDLTKAMPGILFQGSMPGTAAAA